ncbi:hypothetical protein LSCM1_03917 [Leishmania martiniquensis]|uniref:Phosphoinositide phospholipase C n=1 Tax=Leishmania martiniquensis TaxID=1580590 RepID=A0A836GCP6_9TRYP|nr:hypothetical protein LSCM1_03917 [Leishmania martiniquensis]
MPVRSICATLPDPPRTRKDLAAVQDLLSRLKVPLIVRRVTKGNTVVRRTISLTADGKALEYTPTKKSKRQTLLFWDLYEVTQVDPASKVYRWAKLNRSTDVIVEMNTRTRYGWRIVFDDKASANTWLQMIGFKVKGCTLVANGVVPTEDTLKGCIRATWERADTNRDGKVDFREAKMMMVRMNVEIRNDLLADLVRKHDASGDGALDLEEFTTLFIELTQHEELRPLFKSFAADLGWMTRNEFDRFLRAQGDVPSDSLFNALMPRKDGRISFTDFVQYLLSPRLNPALDPAHQLGVVDDMTHPLKDYFISSSHNTYLSGDQFQSSSHIEMYKRALLAGCRCVELDCWDGKDGEPVIYHGYTRTSKVLFVDVIDTIRRHAFTTSPFPVILSLEVHTSDAQCKVMANHLRSVLGRMLVTAKDTPGMTYTPDSLRGKILVKWKLPGKDVDDVEEAVEDTDGNDNGARFPLQEAETSAQGALSHLLSSCVTLGAFKTNDWGRDAEPHYVQSYVETKVNDLAQSYRNELIMQTSRMLVRVYPKGTRIGSSNYNPTTSWSVGAQLVALNYQTWDDDMRMNDGMFSLNKGYGYVLKPKYLRDPSSQAKATPCTITVTVLSGTQIPKPSLQKKGDIADPYVKLSINMRERTEVKTAVVRNNGLNPFWMETFTLFCESKEVDVLTVKVMDEDTTSANDSVCQMVIPVRALRTGYRAVPMKLCKNGASLPGASILCRFDIVDHQPQQS